ncbi:MAG: GIY-YIG nuclease family protein [Chitinispirillales bacterium]|nr:GIY-YIG nuclease family protein [Chitinispirillales bacterium]
MTNDNEKQYVYIVQASLEPSKCKIGKTNDLERRLKEYNNMTGKSQENTYKYLFTCEVKDITLAEKALKDTFSNLREQMSKEIYFYNTALFDWYVNFIKSHKMFVKEIFIKTEDNKQTVKIIKKTTPFLDERGITQKDIMQKAKQTGYDEFYTRLEDVEKEISMYDKEIWKDKVVFCNCDDAVDDDDRNTSAFALYFLQNFKELELKKLICTHYSKKVDLFNQGSKGYIFTKNGFSEFGQKDYPKGFTGSFDDPLSLKILNEVADVVCTNPPFSIAIDYWKILVKSGKKFLIISNISNAINTAYVSYFKDNKVWAGYNRVDWFLNPKKQLADASGHWYTNFPIKDRPKYKRLKIVPLKKIPAKYKKYDDDKILIVDNCYIPSDYKKPFAVSARPILNGILEKGYRITQDTQYVPYMNGKKCFSRVSLEKI